MSPAAWVTCEEPADHAAGSRRTPAFPWASLATQS